MYRVYFKFQGHYFYTEYFDELESAMDFVNLSMYSREVAPVHVEDRDGTIV